jgi:methylated-DNA-[protein]-cysteine S-methyltransferase
MTDGECTYCEDDVLAYVAGDLETEADLEMSVHLADCEDCRESAADFKALDCVVADCCRNEAIRWHTFESAFGRMFAASTSKGVARLTWRDVGEEGFLDWMTEQFPGRPLIRDPEALAEVEREVTEYFQGERTHFDMELDLGAMSEFERQVLEELTEAIRFGQVIPYSTLAKRLGKPRAARAVGNAVGANPVPIIVPCHRVVRLDGSLGGYGGGIEYKEKLLEIEGRQDLLKVG